MRIEEIIAGYSVDEAIAKAFAAVRAGADGVMIHSKDKSGMDIKTLSRLLGHSSIQISLDLYAHVTDQLQLEHISNLEMFLK